MLNFRFLSTRDNVEAWSATGKSNGSFHVEAVLEARLFDLVVFYLG